MLSKDLLKYEIAKHLNIADIIQFISTNKYYGSIDFSQLLIEKIYDRLRLIFGEKCSEFLQQLNQSGDNNVKIKIDQFLFSQL